jgi:hypothetical protein
MYLLVNFENYILNPALASPTSSLFGHFIATEQSELP